jgi:hypothetical protein
MQLDAKALASATAEIVKALVAAETAPLLERLEAIEARPVAERGEKGERGEPGSIGRDGIGLAGAMIDRGGALILTLTDGSTRDLGVVVGKDGRDGEPGPQGERGEPGPQGEKGERGSAGEPGPSGDKGMDGSDGIDGVDGKDGRDGFTLEDFDVQPIDERTIKLMFLRDGVSHSFELVFPVIIDRGVFKAEEAYARGDAVTWGGSLWIAQKETSAKPDTPDSGWRLAVKKGRDGKDAKGSI